MNQKKNKGDTPGTICDRSEVKMGWTFDENRR